MKKIFIVTSMAFFAACNNSTDKAKVDSMKTDSTASTATDRYAGYQFSLPGNLIHLNLKWAILKMQKPF